MRTALEKITRHGTDAYGDLWPTPPVVARSALLKAEQADEEEKARAPDEHALEARLRYANTNATHWHRAYERQATRVGRFRAERDRAREERDELQTRLDAMGVPYEEAS